MDDDEIIAAAFEVLRRRIAERDARIAELEAEVRALEARLRAAADIAAKLAAEIDKA